MKRLFLLMTIVMSASSAFAQDDVVFGGGGGALNQSEINALLGGGRGGNRGGNNTLNLVNDPLGMFTQLRDMLKDKKVPLDKNQEKSLQKLLDEESKAVRALMESQFNTGGTTQNNQANGGRGNPIARIDTLVMKHNGELLEEMKPDLTPDQLALVSKAEKDKKVCLVMVDLINFQQLSGLAAGFGGGGGFPGGGFGGGGFPGGGGFGGGDFPGGGGFGGGGFPGGGGVELPNRQSCTSAESTVAQRLAPLADVLSKGKKPLTTDQEQKFKPLIEARLALMEQEGKEQGLPTNFFTQIRSLPNFASLQNNPQQLVNNIVNTVMNQIGLPSNGNANFGNRGGGNRGGNNANPQAEIQKRSEGALDKVIATLKPAQQPVVKKYKYDQMKARGGAERYRAILEEEGTPLTAAQLTQIQGVINTENQAVRQFATQQAQTVLASLPPAPPPPTPTPQNPGVQNNNNVNNNPQAQQVVAQVLPRVSVQHATLEKAMNDAILKLLTPAQVASYKVNGMQTR